MIQLDFAALRAAPAASDPFPHVVVPNFVPPQSLQQVVAALPPIGNGGSYPPGSLRLGPAASDLVQAMEGPELRQAIAEKFALDLSAAPTMLTVRGRTREKDGRIHTDSKAKKITVLLYLNPDPGRFTGHQGCLRLLRNATDIDDYAVEVPPVNGTLLVFPNGPTSWHGHKQFVGPRYAIQLNYMTNDSLARSEMRRHRLSALVKRFTRAA
jgi:SM-20-related protein